MNTEEEKKNVEVTPAEPAKEVTPEEPQKEETPVELPATKEETKKEEPKEEKKEEVKEVGIGEEIPMSEEEKAAKKAAQAQNFNSQEEVVYTMKAEKGANPIGVVIFFALLISFIFLLPKIVSKYGSLFDQKHVYFNGSTELPPEEEKKEETQPIEDKDIHSFLKSEKVKIDGLTFINFVKTNLNNGQYSLTFSVMNENEKLFDFSTKYYMELYAGSIKIGNKLIHSYESIAPKSAVQVTIALTKEEYDSAINYKIVKRTTNEYPEITFTDKKDDYDILTCTKDNNIMVYYFKDNLLEKIDDDVRVPNTEANYAGLLEAAKAEAEKTRQVEGIDSNVIETNQSGYDIKTNIDLSKTQPSDLSSLRKYKYFIFHEKAKIVKYEMTALTYKCS